MKTFKGTKGEWKITEVNGSNSLFIESGVECIGTVWRSSECNANAKLIAAAPELLEALQEIVGVLSDPDYIVDSFTTQPAIKAINKALGE